MSKEINCGCCGKPVETGSAFHKDAQACAEASQQKVVRRLNSSSNFNCIAHTNIQYSGK